MCRQVSRRPGRSIGRKKFQTRRPLSYGRPPTEGAVPPMSFRRPSRPAAVLVMRLVSFTPLAARSFPELSRPLGRAGSIRSKRLLLLLCVAVVVSAVAPDAANGEGGRNIESAPAVTFGTEYSG